MDSIEVGTRVRVKPSYYIKDFVGRIGNVIEPGEFQEDDEVTLLLDGEDDEMYFFPKDLERIPA